MNADLRNYVIDLNFWRKLSNTPLIEFPLNAESIKDIVYHLEGDLSPENLHCDGEISNAEANRKYRRYMRVITQLESVAGHTIDLCY